MKTLVTGGGGFLGRRIVELLLEAGHEVRFLARSHYPEVEALGAEGRQADLQDAEAVANAIAGCDAVLHVAAKAGYWGRREDFAGINIDGTQHVIDGCRRHGVGRLVYTSTPSVIGYAREAEGIAQAPYPDTWESFYGETKALAEQRVLAASDGDLATVSIRPHLIVGPRDNHLLPRVIARAKQGRLRIVGDGENVVDVTYVDNAAWAHLDALDALDGPDAPCAGKAYFLSNDEPVKLWVWTNDILERLGAPPVRRRVSLATASRVGGILEAAWRWLPLPGEPPMTRFVAAALARAHWYDMTPAKTDLGYRVRVPLTEGTDRTVAWFRGAATDPRAPS